MSRYLRGRLKGEFGEFVEFVEFVWVEIVFQKAQFEASANYLNP